MEDEARRRQAWGFSFVFSRARLGSGPGGVEKGSGWDGGKVGGKEGGGRYMKTR